jgi:hypothetical protein
MATNLSSITSSGGLPAGDAMADHWRAILLPFLNPVNQRRSFQPEKILRGFNDTRLVQESGKPWDTMRA